MLSLYVNFTKISEVSMYTPVDGFLEHPLIGKHGVTFTLDGGVMHRDFNMIELFMALRQHKSWAELNMGFVENPLRVYTELAQGLVSPWLYVPYGTQVWFNRHLVLGHPDEHFHLDDEEIINKCRLSSKFRRTGVNTLTMYQGQPIKFSKITYDLTEDCSVLSGHVIYVSGSLRHTGGVT